MSEILQFLHLKISSLRCLTHKALTIVSIQSISKKKKIDKCKTLTIISRISYSGIQETQWWPMRIKLLNKSCYLLQHSNNVSCIIESTNFIKAFAVHLGHSLMRVFENQNYLLTWKLEQHAFLSVYLYTSGCKLLTVAFSPEPARLGSAIIKCPTLRTK